MKHRLYDSGDLFLPQTVRTFLETELIGRQQDTFYITYWSLIHGLSGILFGFVLSILNIQHYYTTCLVVHTCWELWQVYIGMAHPYNTCGKGNIVDIFMDTLLFMTGAAIYKQWL
jgi:hypothetical protein